MDRCEAAHPPIRDISTASPRLIDESPSSGQRSTAHGHSPAHLRPELGEPHVETATIRGPRTAHRLFRSTGPPQRVMTLRSKRSSTITASRLPPTRSATAGIGPEGSSRRTTTLCERRHHHSQRYTTIQSPDMQQGRVTTPQSRRAALTCESPPCVNCERQRRPGERVSGGRSSVHPIG